MSCASWSRTAVIVGMLVTGGSLASVPAPVSAMDMQDPLVVAESSIPRANTLLEDVIGSDRMPQESRPEVPRASSEERPLRTPIIVRPDGRPVRRAGIYYVEELVMEDVIEPANSLGQPAKSIMLQYGERSYDVPLGLPSPFIFDPARGILVLDAQNLLPKDIQALDREFITMREPAGQPLPPVNRPGQSLNGAPEPVAGLFGFIKALVVNPDLGIFAVIGPGLAALGLLRRLRSEQPGTRKRSEAQTTVDPASRALVPMPQSEPDDREPLRATEPECTEKLPARRSAA